MLCSTGSRQINSTPIRYYAYKELFEMDPALVWIPFEEIVDGSSRKPPSNVHQL